MKVEYDNGTSSELVIFEDTPIVVPPVTPKKYVLLNAINWNAAGLNSLPIADTSECTYFVLTVESGGALMGGSPTLEAKFISDVKAGGKKATFSIAGGSQNIAAITAAVNQKTNLVNSIAARITSMGYDGVTLDIENTNIAPQAMVDFVLALRAKIGPEKIIGQYTQPFQLNTVFSLIQNAAPALTWLSPMIYDAGPFDLQTFTIQTRAWEGKVGKSKLMGGVAVNYPPNDGGLSVTQYGQVLDVVNTEGWAGVGLWQNTLFTEPYRAIQKNKFPNLK